MAEETVIKLPSRRNGREANAKMIERAVWGSKEMVTLRESTQSHYGIDIRDRKAFPAGLDGWNWSKYNSKIMRETNSSSAQAQLLRAGIQTAVNNMYPSVPTTFEDWAHVIQSSRDTELYAPLNALTFPGEVGKAEKYIEASVVGLDIKLRNRKYGEIFPVEKELLEDDQTGQMQQKVGEMAEYAKLVYEVLCYAKLASVASMSYSNLSVPTSETKPSTESNYPWSGSGGFTAGKGVNSASAAALTDANLKAALTALDNMLNLQGLKMAVMTDTLIIGTKYRWDAATLLNSSYYPAGAQSAGVTGGAFSENQLKSIVKPVMSRFVFDQNGTVNANSSAWFLADTSKPGFVAQMRVAAEVTEENPLSGQSFDRDIVRWKLRIRGNADFIEPRLFYRGSDGSA